jgi:hypothetical protein
MLNSTVRRIVRRYGVKITWLRASGGSLDVHTGKKTDQFVPKHIRRALVLEEAITEKFTYDLSYIAANKNFIQGGFYAQGKLSIAVLKSDVSVYSMPDRVEINGVVYRILKAFDNPNGIWGFNLVDIKNAV